MQATEWRIRVTFTDGTVRAGRYIGAQDHHIYMMDPNTGEIHDIQEAHVANIDIKPPGTIGELTTTTERETA